MIQLAYLSSTKTLLPADEIEDILVTSRRNNGLQDITGMLLYKNGNVLQLLEGEREEVLKLFHKIEKDERHHGIIRLYEKHITTREFPEWTMGFHDLNAEAVRAREGFSEFLNPSFEFKTLKPTQAAKLMGLFRSASR